MSQIRSASAPRVPVPRPRSSSVSSVGPRRRARAPHHPRPSRTGHAPSRIRPARGRSPTPSRTGHKTETDHVIRLLSTAPEQTLIVNPLIRGRSDVRRSLSAYDSRAASRIPSCAAPAPTNKIVARAPPPAPVHPGDAPVPTTKSRSVHTVRDRVPAGASHGHPFSARTSTVLTTNKYRSRECRETRSTGLWKAFPRQSARSSTAQLRTHPGLSVRIRPPGARHHSADTARPHAEHRPAPPRGRAYCPAPTP